MTEEKFNFLETITTDNLFLLSTFASLCIASIVCKNRNLFFNAIEIIEGTIEKAIENRIGEERAGRISNPESEIEELILSEIQIFQERERQREELRINNTNPETGERETERMFLNTNPAPSRQR